MGDVKEYPVDEDLTEVFEDEWQEALDKQIEEENEDEQ